MERDPVAYPVADGRQRERAAAGRALRDALGCFATGVAVVTALSDEGRPVGLTINSFNSLSLDPPLILWSLRASSPLAACFVPGTRFAVNVLGSAQEAVARQFSTPRPDRFVGIRWRMGPSALPHLDGAVAYFDCRLQDSHEAGDHRLLIGAVERFAAPEGEPLLFVHGSFRTL